MPVIGVVEPGARAAVAATHARAHRRHRHRRHDQVRRVRARDSRAQSRRAHHRARLSAVRAARRGGVDRPRRDAPHRRANISQPLDRRRDRHARARLHALSAAQAAAAPRCSDPSVRLIDSAEETAAETARTLATANLAAEPRRRSDLSLHRLRRSAAVSAARAAVSRRDDGGRGDPHSRLIPPIGAARRVRRHAQKRRRIEPRPGVGVRGAARETLERRHVRVAEHQQLERRIGAVPREWRPRAARDRRRLRAVRAARLRAAGGQRASRDPGAASETIESPADCEARAGSADIACPRRAAVRRRARCAFASRRCSPTHGPKR